MDSAQSSTSTPSPRLEWFLLHAGFVVVGVITTCLGPLLPMFAKQWGLSDARAGSFFPAQYCVSLFGVIATGWLLPRFGFSKVLGTGFLVLTIGLLFLGVSPWYLTAMFVSVYGLGYGLVNPTTNLRGTQLPSSNMAAAVSLLNFSWGIGAVLCPFLVAALVPIIGVRGFGACVAVLTLMLAVAHFIRPASPVVAASERVSHSPANWMEQLRKGPAVPLLLLFFFYVGTECAVGGWVAALEKRMPSGGPMSALAIAPSVFYGGMLLGRGSASLVLRRFSTTAISVSGLVLTTVGTGAIAMANSKLVLLAGVGIAGLGCAPQYPILVTWLARYFGKDSDWLGALFFSAGSLGGGVLPKLVGSIATESHSLRAGFLVPLVASITMVFLAMKIRPHTR